MGVVGWGTRPTPDRGYEVQLVGVRGVSAGVAVVVMALVARFGVVAGFVRVGGVSLAGSM